MVTCEYPSYTYTYIFHLLPIDDMSLSLEGKIAIVTGASRSRGIGAQVAYELAKRGAKVCDEDTKIPRESL